MLRVLFTYRIGRVMEIEKMITKKEDLIGTEFKVTCKEEADLLKEKCKSLGIEHATWSSCSYTGGVMRGVIGKDLGTYHSCKLLFTDKPEDSESMDEFKSLRFVNIKDLKPRTKTEFVKCEFLREWEAVRYYNEDGELFVVDCNGNYTNVNDISCAWYEVVCKNYHNIYRQVETEIDERQEFIDKCMLIGGLRARDGAGEVYGNLYDSGKFKLVEK